MPERLSEDLEHVVLWTHDPTLHNDSDAGCDVQSDNRASRRPTSGERADPSTHTDNRLRGGPGVYASSSATKREAETLLVLLGIGAGRSSRRKSRGPAEPRITIF